MSDQKPMGTSDAATNPDADKQRRLDEAAAKMKDRPELAQRIRAAHPAIADSDDALKVALADYDRLVEENPKPSPAA